MSFARITPDRVPRPGVNRDRLDVRPKAIEEWLSGLPLADPEQTARLLLETLNVTTGIGLKPQVRLRLLGQIEPAVDHATTALRKRYALHPLPLARRGRAAVGLVLDLAEAMARGYRLVTFTDRGGLLGLRAARRAQALAGICHHAGVVLLECWQLYQFPPEGTWETLHRTRRGAGVQRLHQRRVQVSTGRRNTIEQAYKCLLLTAAANPWAMPRGDVLEVFRLLEPIAAETRLVAAGRGRVEGATFMVNVDGDEEPRPLSGAGTAGEGRWLFVDTARVLASLRRLDARGRVTGRADPDSDAARIGRLVQVLGQPAIRAQERAAVQSEITLVAGLGRIAHFLQRPGGGEQAAAGAVESPVAMYDEGAEHLVASPVAGFHGRDGGIGIARETGWRETDTSASGCRLRASGAGATRTRARVGELVLVDEPQRTLPGGPRTGVVRWMQRHGTDGVELGVQIIGHDPQPVLAALEEDEGLEHAVECLLLAAAPELGQPESLLLPHLQAGPEARLRILDNQGQYLVELAGRHDSTPSFAQFAFIRKPAEAVT